MLDDGGYLAVLMGAEDLRHKCIEKLKKVRGADRVASFAGDNLAALNRRRDALLKPKSVTLVTLETSEQVAELLKQAPDLTDWLSLTAELVAPSPDADTLDREIVGYLERTRERYSTLDLTGLIPGFSQAWKIALDEIYLDVVTPKPASPFDFFSRVNPFTSQEERKFLILGHAGSGKTTALRKHVHTYCTQGLDQPCGARMLPILVPAVAYAQACSIRLRPFSDFLAEHLGKCGLKHPDAVLAAAGPRLVVMLDALDEVPGSLSAETVLRRVNAFANKYGEAKILITSRPEATSAYEKHLDDFSRQPLETLRPDQVKQFVTSFVAAHHRATNAAHHEQSAQQLNARIEQAPALKELAKTPLTLTFLALLHVIEGRLPERRVALYHRLSQLLIERWNAARSLAGPRMTMPYGQALRVFAPLAWWLIREHPAGTVGEAQLREQLVAQLIRRQESREDAEKSAVLFLTRLRRDTALLLPVGDQFSFFHATVAEYLAGVEVARNHRLREQLVEERRLFDPSLREVVLFAAGELGTIRADDEMLAIFVEQILEQSKKPGRYDARYSSLLTSLLLEDVGLVRTQEQQVVTRLCQLFFDYTYRKKVHDSVLTNFARIVVTGTSRIRDFVQVDLRIRLKNPVTGFFFDSFALEDFRLSDDGFSAPLFSFSFAVFLRALDLPTTPLIDALIASDNPAARIAGWLTLGFFPKNSELRDKFECRRRIESHPEVRKWIDAIENGLLDRE